MGLILLQGGLKWEQGAEPPPPEPPHFNHWGGLDLDLDNSRPKPEAISVVVMKRAGLV